MYTQETECEKCLKYTTCYYRSGSMLCEECLEEFVDCSSVLYYNL